MTYIRQRVKSLSSVPVLENGDLINTNSSSNGDNTNSLKSNEYNSEVWENIIMGIRRYLYNDHRSMMGFIHVFTMTVGIYVTDL